MLARSSFALQKLFGEMCAIRCMVVATILPPAELCVKPRRSPPEADYYKVKLLVSSTRYSDVLENIRIPMTKPQHQKSYGRALRPPEECPIRTRTRPGRVRGLYSATARGLAGEI